MRGKDDRLLFGCTKTLTINVCAQVHIWASRTVLTLECESDHTFVFIGALMPAVCPSMSINA